MVEAVPSWPRVPTLVSMYAEAVRFGSGGRKTARRDIRLEGGLEMYQVGAPKTVHHCEGRTRVI